MPPLEAEWLTRKSRIDTRLKQNGWKLVRFSPELNLNALDKIAVEELPTANGPADYGLFVAGRLLEIVEAKKVAVNPQNVLEQAKRYARGGMAKKDIKLVNMRNEQTRRGITASELVFINGFVPHSASVLE